MGALALVITGVAAAGPQIGFAEDGTKFAEDGGARLFDEMTKISTTTNRVAVFWDGSSNIVDQAFLDRMIPVARAKKIQVVFAIYPQKATLAPTSQSGADSFCDYAVKVMQRYPYVRKVIIGNEPNQPEFWQPIWNGSQPASPAAMEVVLASCYDKLKAFDSSLDVIGVGLSPRGNDDPGASSNSSISPVRWITGRGQPTLPGYPADTTGSTLYGSTARMFIDETGWQVDTTGRPGYTNMENIPVVSEAKQAEDYEKLVHLANCEPTLTAFHIFHEIDEADRTGFQSGVLRVDFSARDSALSTPNSVQHAVKADNGGCAGGVWQTLGSFLYASNAVVPLYKTFPY